jgi:hypothetical protein
LLSREVELLRRGKPRLYGEFGFGACGDESPRKPTAARPYKSAATSRRAFIPIISGCARLYGAEPRHHTTLIPTVTPKQLI